MKLFFDLDGTLLDSRERLYNLFQYLVPDSTLTFEQYWELKRSKNNHKFILQNMFAYDDEKYSIFEQKWMNKIESFELLSLDKPYDGVFDFLENLSVKNRLYIVTARQYEQRVLEQLKKLGLISFFEKVLVTGQKKTKEDLIKSACTFSSNDCMIGDMGKDIQVGKNLGMQTIALSHGFTNREKLLEYNPDKIFDSIVEIYFEDV